VDGITTLRRVCWRPVDEYRKEEEQYVTDTSIWRSVQVDGDKHRLRLPSNGVTERYWLNALVVSKRQLSRHVPLQMEFARDWTLGLLHYGSCLSYCDSGLWEFERETTLRIPSDENDSGGGDLVAAKMTQKRKLTSSGSLPNDVLKLFKSSQSISVPIRLKPRASLSQITSTNAASSTVNPTVNDMCTSTDASLPGLKQKQQMLSHTRSAAPNLCRNPFALQNNKNK
jgi:hypothetical protein